MDLKLKKWIKWFDVIQNEVTNLLIQKDIFWEVNNIVKNNTTIQKPSSFYKYFGDTYIAYVIMGIRRQIKINKYSISLARLLSEIIRNPEKISRKYYTSLYKGSDVEYFADKHFDKFTDTNGDYISEKMVKEDLVQLRQAAIKCEELADKRFAHTDKRKPKQIIMFKDIDNSIDLLDKLCVKYNIIFHAASMETLMPVYQYDWMDIFKYPWLID